MSVFDLIVNVLIAGALTLLFGPWGLVGYLIAIALLALGSALVDRLPR